MRRISHLIIVIFAVMLAAAGCSRPSPFHDPDAELDRRFAESSALAEDEHIRHEDTIQEGFDQQPDSF